jgi:hypothetical protein
MSTGKAGTGAGLELRNGWFPAVADVGNISFNAFVS